MPDAYLFSDYLLDCQARELRYRDEVVAMPARVFECLQYLIEQRGRAVARDELALAVFARDNVSDAQLSQIVLRARRAVGDDGQEQRMIRTVPRFGFRWVADTQVLDSGNRSPPGEERGSAGNSPPTPSMPARRADRRHDSGRVRRQRWILATLAALALLLTTGAWWALSQRQPVPVPVTLERAMPGMAVIVLPTDVHPAGESAWARLGLMDFLGNRLRHDGLPVASSESVVSLLHGKNGIDVDELLPHAVGSGWIVTSRAVLGDGGWRVELAARDADGMTRQAAATHVDMLEAADQAAARLLAALGRADDGSQIDLSLAERLQRAQAALLGNELDTALRILEEAPPVQRDDPELVLRRAQVEHRAGRHTRADELIAVVLESDRAHAEPELRARALLLRGGVCIRLDCHAQGERDYTAAASLVEADARPALLGEALNGRGVTRSMLGDFDGALRDLGEARILLARSGDLLSVARVDANLGFLERLRGRPSQALEYMGRTVESFRRFGAIHELVAMHSALAETHLQLLQPEQAHRSMDHAWAMRERITDRTQATGVALGRAQVLMNRGRFEQAQALLEAYGDGPVIPADLHRAQALQAELALRRGQPAHAASIADQALAGWQHDRARPERLVRLRLLRMQASVAAGEPPPADLAFVAEPTPDGTVWQHLLSALAAHARGEHERAGDAYRSAVTHAERDGVPEEVAAAVLAHANWALERGLPAEVAAMVGRIAPWSGEDFDLALLQVRLFHALGQIESWEAALQDAQRLAGERRIPSPLLLPPPRG